MGIKKKIRKRKAATYSKNVKKGHKKKKTETKVNNQHYQNKETLKANYKLMGIQLDPNNIKTQQTNKTQFLDQLTKYPIKKQKPVMHMALEEQQAILKLIQKYTDNTERMVSDRKLNTFYWNENQMKKKIDQYKKLQQLVADN